MAQRIRVSNGERVYFSATISASGTSIASDSFKFGLGTYDTPPATWDIPDNVTAVDNNDITVYRWIGNQTGDNNPAAGTYWPWVQVVDVGGERRQLRVPTRLVIS